MRKQKSFTLIELMVVIAIIIVLAAIAIPTYMNMTRRANKASVGSNMGVLATGLATYQTDWGKYPVSLTAVNVAEVTDSFYKEFTGGGEVNNRGGSAAYLSASTLKNLRNPFYPADPAHGIMYVSDEAGTHYCLFAKISNNENATAFNPLDIQNVYATEEPVPAETGSFLYRTDTSSNITSSAWAALTSDPAKYPGAMALTVSINPLGAGTVTLSPSGGVYLVNTPVTLTETPAAGSSFVGWNDGATSTTTTVSMTSNKTVTANFALQTFPLTYTASDGGTISGTTPQTVNYAGSGTLVTAVPATNYHFVAWSDGITTTARTDTNVVAAKTVTATFVLDTYTLTASTGSNGTVTPTGVTTKAYGTTQAYVITPAAGYHTFAITVDGEEVLTTSPYTFTAIVAAHTISATFAIDTYTVTFDKNGGATEANPTAMTVNYNVVLGTLPDGPTKPGYAFTNWNTVSDGGGATFAGTTPVIASLTVYAQWTVADQTLIFASNGGTVVIALTQAFGTSISAPTAPTKTGYTFAGWYNESGLSTVHTFSTMGLSTTVYAKWTINTFTLTYTAGANGTITGASPQTVNYGASGTAVIAVADINYHFVNWSDSGGTAARTEPNVTADKTITANFAINQYVVTFKNWDGTTLSTPSVNYGGTASAPSNPTRTGYMFAAWDRGLTNITAITTITATYTAIPLTGYSVTGASQGKLSTAYTFTANCSGGSGTYTYAWNGGGTGSTKVYSWGLTGAQTVSVTITDANNGLAVSPSTTCTIALAIGDSYQGGKIAYIDGTGQHGLIAAVGDERTGVGWSGSKTLVGGTSAALGSGSANTDKIVALFPYGSAACYARAYAGGGFHDWYLPSLNELSKLYLYRADIGGFGVGMYWSSTEVDVNFANKLYFADGGTYSQGKLGGADVRPVRSF